AYAIQARYTAELAKFYGLPSRCGGTLTDAPGLSAQSGYESMLNMLTTFQNGVNLVVHSAGMLDRYAAVSVEKFVMDVEIIDMVRYYLNDLDANGDTLNLEVIRSVGPGGQFLTTLDTLTKCRSHTWSSSLAERGHVDGMSIDQRFLKRIGIRHEAMLAAYSPPSMDPAQLAELDGFLVGQGVDRSLLATIGDGVSHITNHRIS
ncbi:MAG: trimethylamine methyltransferase family protein, partial [Desulfosarcina sp.]